MVSSELKIIGRRVGRSQRQKSKGRPRMDPVVEGLEEKLEELGDWRLDGAIKSEHVSVSSTGGVEKVLRRCCPRISKYILRTRMRS